MNYCEIWLSSSRGVTFTDRRLIHARLNPTIDSMIISYVSVSINWYTLAAQRNKGIKNWVCFNLLDPKRSRQAIGFATSPCRPGQYRWVRSTRAPWFDFIWPPWFCDRYWAMLAAAAAIENRGIAPSVDKKINTISKELRDLLTS